MYRGVLYVLAILKVRRSSYRCPWDWKPLVMEDDSRVRLQHGINLAHVVGHIRI